MIAAARGWFPAAAVIVPRLCDCGARIPAGRVAYCSARCRLADMDHGSDIDPMEDAA